MKAPIILFYFLIFPLNQKGINANGKKKCGNEYHLKRIICFLWLSVLILGFFSFLIVLNLPTSVEEVCPNIPSLVKLMEEIVELAESGIRYTQMPHIMEVILPMLCSYMSHWWEHGPENNPDKVEVCCTALTSEHMNTLLGNILKIIYNNLGIDEGAWMKRLAGKM